MGTTLTRCDVRVPRYATVDLSGRVVDEVLSRGKHLFIQVGDASIHSHLKMDGSWRVTCGGRPGRADHTVRIILETGDVRAAGVDLACSRCSTARTTRTRSPTSGRIYWRRLGSPAGGGEPDRRPGLPDRRGAAGSAGAGRGGQRVLQRAVFRVRPTAHQRGQHPARPTARDDPHARDVVGQPVTDQPHDDRQPQTGPGRWVYGRAGRPCRRCGTPIRPRGVLRRDRGAGYVLVSVVPALADSEGDGAIFAISSATSASRLSIDVRSIRTARKSSARYSVDSMGPRPLG